MGDRCTVMLTIGGKLPRGRVGQLCEAMKDEGFYNADDESPLSEELLLAGKHATFQADEANYGLIEGVTDLLDELDMDYDVWNGAGGGYGEGLCSCKSGVMRQAPVCDGEVMIPISLIVKVETLVTGMAGLLEEARWWSIPLRPLEIVEDEETTP